MTTKTFEDELADATGQAQIDLLDALEAATARLREAIANESTVGMRESSEALVAIDNALRRFRA